VVLCGSHLGVAQQHQHYFKCQLPFDMTISVNSAPLHEPVMHHA